MTAVGSVVSGELIRRLLREPPDATGTAVAVMHGDRKACHGTGFTAKDRTQPITPETRFEIGSVTKTFTALLLADMVRRGEVRYEDPVDDHLPPGWRLRRPAPITLGHLATHTSGLPQVPLTAMPRILPTWFSNPYQALGPAEVRAALTRVRLRSAPGSRCHYSNFGVGLLGWLLAEAAGLPFEQLLEQRVLRPLGLTATSGIPTPQAVGHRHGRALPPWHIPGLSAAGVLRSTAHDMLTYLAAHLAPDTTPLASALTDVIRPRIPLADADDLCLLWFRRARPKHDLLFHSGGTSGFTTFVGFSPQSRTALVALTNAGATRRGNFIQRSYETLRALAMIK
ncbi:CubicO group peptidase, beta-lactamase class C family [Lentzea xinjiangensis]|uniref:CubicO group peptidase, beta-lactamase class C family n=1 Tax=Lentzea xinjiangensis TaxID=402600 RepID=A0A1H9NEV6_9PSEU|nr:serine hydrolase domain-containing protein [Lentzea xinjiangensis]SER34438.1 CubicO group peptidase, beta-lactamase class C family [Lentzea xinjiangensis]